jgi:hypothetical protein
MGKTKEPTPIEAKKAELYETLKVAREASAQATQLAHDAASLFPTFRNYVDDPQLGENVAATAHLLAMKLVSATSAWDNAAHAVSRTQVELWELEREAADG